MYLGHVVTSVAEGTVRVAWIVLGLFVSFVFIVLALFLYTLLADVHEIDIRVACVVVYFGGELGTFFVGVEGIEGIFQFHVWGVWVVEWRDGVLAIVKVHGNLEACAFQELAQLQISRYAEGRIGLEGVVADVAVQGTEAC